MLLIITVYCAKLYTEQTKCVNYEFDPQKVELQLQRKDNLETERS